MKQLNITNLLYIAYLSDVHLLARVRRFEEYAHIIRLGKDVIVLYDGMHKK